MDNMIATMENRSDVWSYKIKDHSMLTGMFSDSDNAERAYQKLNEKGYGDEDIFWSRIYDTGIIVIGVKPHNMADAEDLENDWRNHKGEIIYR